MGSPAIVWLQQINPSAGVLLSLQKQMRARTYLKPMLSRSKSGKPVMQVLGANLGLGL